MASAGVKASLNDIKAEFLEKAHSCIKGSHEKIEAKGKITGQTKTDILSKLGKENVVCRDSQGFISTRVLVALRLECYRLLEERVASMEDIDMALKLAFDHSMGQFELADFSGLDIEPPIFEI